MQMYFEVILELKFYCYKIIIHAEANIPRYDREIKRERDKWSGLQSYFSF